MEPLGLVRGTHGLVLSHLQGRAVREEHRGLAGNDLEPGAEVQAAELDIPLQREGTDEYGPVYARGLGSIRHDGERLVVDIEPP